MQQLVRVINERRIRLKESFQDYDRLHSGLITASQFVRVLTAARLVEVLPTQGSLDEIVAQYAVEGSNPQKVNYAAFLAVVEDPKGAVVMSGVAAGSPTKSLPDSDEAVLARAADGFVQVMKNTGLDPRVAFRDFDKTNCGKVTSTQFARSFPFRTDPRVLKLLTAKYATADGALVRYGDWVTDLRDRYTAFIAANAADWVRNAQAGAGKSAPSSPSKSTSAVAGEAVLRELAHNVFVTRSRVDHLFQDVDPAHTGRTTVARFASILSSLRLSRFSLSADNLEQLIQLYTVPSEFQTVDYRRFIGDVEALVDAESGSNTQSATFANGGAKELLSTKGTTADFRDEDLKRLDVVLSKVKLELRTRSATLRPTFKDFDRASKGTYTTGICTRTRFERALALNGVRLSGAEVDLLARVYGNGPDGFAYQAFCNDVEPIVVVAPVQSTAVVSSSEKSAAATAEASSVDVVAQALNEIAAITRRRGVRLTYFLRDFDPLRANRIAADKFLSALGIAGVSASLSQEALIALVAKYDAKNGDGTVNYAAFLADVEEVVKQRVSTPLAGTRGGSGAAPSATGNDLHRALIERLRQWVRNRGVLLPPFFLDYDVHHNGRVTATQFLQLLKRHQVPVTPQEADVLAAAYVDPVLSTHVQYRPFISDIDDTENLEVVKKVANSTTVLSPSARDALLATASKARSEQSVEGLIRRIATAVQRGARAQEFIRDADPLRKQTCHKSRLAAGVAALGVHLTGEEVELLTTHYASADVVDHVNYPLMLRDVDTILNQAADTSDPVGAGLTLSMGASSMPLYAAKTATLLSDAFLSRLVSRVKSQSNSRRLSLNVVFQDYDHLRRGKITEAQFFSALATLSIKFTPVETKALLAVIGLGANEVAYAPFCTAVENAPLPQA